MGSIDEGSIFTILVTGFEAFEEEYPLNPSYEIAKILPKHIEPSKRCPHAIRIIVHDEPIPVVYDAVRNLVPKLLGHYAETIHMVLHIGMAGKRDYYAIEELAHRDGYTRHKDLIKEQLPLSHGRAYFQDTPAIVRPSVAFEKLWHDWQKQVEDVDSALTSEDLRKSDDAGRFLCDYIYLNSLVWYGRKNGVMAGGTVLARPVMFLHVPAASDATALKDGREAVIGLIRAMCVQFADRRDIRSRL